MQLCEKTKKDYDFCSRNIIGNSYLQLQIDYMLKDATLETFEKDDSIQNTIRSWK